MRSSGDTWLLKYLVDCLPGYIYIILNPYNLKDSFFGLNVANIVAFCKPPLFQRFGGKRVFGYFMLMTAIATLFTPIGARGSPYILVTLRIIKGLGEVTRTLHLKYLVHNTQFL